MSLSVTKELVLFAGLKRMNEKRETRISLVHLFKKPIHAYSLENVCECQKNNAIIVIYVKICLPFIFYMNHQTKHSKHSDINHLHLQQVNREPLLADADHISTGVPESTHVIYGVCSLLLENCIANYIPYM